VDESLQLHSDALRRNLLEEPTGDERVDSRAALKEQTQESTQEPTVEQVGGGRGRTSQLLYLAPLRAVLPSAAEPKHARELWKAQNAPQREVIGCVVVASVRGSTVVRLAEPDRVLPPATAGSARG
jgi:hypothetical protein